MSSPLTGKGLYYFDEDNALSPHDFFLYGLAQFGIGAVLLWAVIVYKMYRINIRLRYGCEATVVSFLYSCSTIAS